jgi:ABC-2 type transport system permease protein
MPDAPATGARVAMPTFTSLETVLGGLPQPGLRHLLLPKWLATRARLRSDTGARGRPLLLATGATLFWGASFAVLYRLLVYFRGVEEIGPLLAGKLLGLILLSFASVLLLSNVITSMSTFFLARDLDFLVSSPADWLTLYLAKLIETVVNSSWMVLLMAVPLFTAYGLAYHGGVLYPLLVLAVFLPFLVIPAAVGSAVTLVLVNVFPARRTRDILSVISLLAAGGVVVLLRVARPERLARPDGFRSLVDYMAELRTPTSPLLPSEWAQRSVMSWLDGGIDLLSMGLLWSTAAAFVVLGGGLHRWLFARGYSKAQLSGGRTSARPSWPARAGHALLAPLGVMRRELVLKELRLFFRDSTQWSQLVLLGVLVVVYVFNVRALPLRGGGTTFFLVNAIPFLNLLLAGFVLASVAARFIFPGVSLEGRTLWLLRSSPLAMRDLLWAKFWTGTVPLLVLALAIVGTTDALLGVTPFIFAVSLFTVTFMTFAVAGLAIGFGTLYPRFDTENAAQIPTSFGGLLFMMAAVATIAGVVVLEARPVYAYLSAHAAGRTPGVSELAGGLVLAVALCLAATFIPIHVALRRLETLER